VGLGGYLAWTAVAREISKRLPPDVKILPCEGDGKTVSKIVRSEVFENNPYILTRVEEGVEAFPMFLNNPQANYCKTDTPYKAHHRYDKHIIEQMCEFYNIENPELRCELYFTEAERQNITKLTAELGDEYIVVEPYSKDNYTPNRSYPLGKWQEIINELSKKIQVVQVGLSNYPLLKNMIDFRGKTSFRSAALLIEKAKLFMSTEGGLVHAATCVDTTSIVIITGYQDTKMVAYPQNININIGSHGPCGLKLECPECTQDAISHNYKEILDKAIDFLS
tara:strand:- start:992 stop:1828 length:837 start_codon:yes stop_codon:yes gene_type:complete